MKLQGTRKLASHADVRRGSSRVPAPRAGTRDLGKGDGGGIKEGRESLGGKKNFLLSIHQAENSPSHFYKSVHVAFE